MEKLLNADVQKQLKQVFEELVNPVTMVLFTEDDCESCEPTLSLLTEIAELSDKLNLRVYDINSDGLVIKFFNEENGYMAAVWYKEKSAAKGY